MRLLAPAFALALAATTARAAPAAPAPTPELTSEVDALLGAIHGPVSPEVFRALGPGAEEALAAIARSGAMPSKRIRALEALAGLGGPRAEETHRAVAASDAPTAVRRGAVRGLGRLAGPGRAPGLLAPYLDGDRDPAVRAAAAEALAEAAPAQACARVRARAQAEGGAGRFRRALDACARAAP